MKKISMVVAMVVASVAASPAFAIAVSGWERPIYKAQMRIEVRDPQLDRIQRVELVMTQQDGKKEATGFIVLADGHAKNFEVIETKMDRCGSVYYTAAPVTEKASISIQNVRLLVADHSHRVCDSIPNHGLMGVWQASLQDMGKPMMNMAGAPQPVVTIN